MVDQLEQDQRRGQVRNARLVQHGDKGRIVADDGVGTSPEEEVQRFLLPSPQATFVLEKHCAAGVVDHRPHSLGLENVTDRQGGN